MARRCLLSLSLAIDLKRILVIRGGAIGDFILTLPAIKLLRDRFPDTHLEILGYKHIIALAENRFYANATRSIEYGPLASFFAAKSDLTAELSDYFRSFDLIVSYLFDPDELFSSNLRRCGVKNLITGPAKLTGKEHAAQQLAEPMEKLGLRLDDCRSHIYLADADRAFAKKFLGGFDNVVALHPGSGSETKNWPVESWRQFGEQLFSSGRNIVVVTGEADQSQLALLRRAWRERRARFANNLPLPHLAAILEGRLFVGHDSGISHLAASVGARCLLLFGPTDPRIWAPPNTEVAVLQSDDLPLLTLDRVIKEIPR